MGDFVLQYWLEVFFGAATFAIGVGYKQLASKIKDNNRKQEALEKGIQALLRDRIIQVYNHYTDKGFCPIYALENAEALFIQYKELGGNGTVTGLMDKLRELPTEGV